jgi:hypothetical protein
MLGFVGQITDSQSRKFIVLAETSVANAAGSGDGASVTTPLTFEDQFGNGQLPGDSGQGRYTVSVTPSQPCVATVTGKTSSGFNVVLTPLSSGAALAAGSFDLIVVG